MEKSRTFVSEKSIQVREPLRPCEDGFLTNGPIVSEGRRTSLLNKVRDIPSAEHQTSRRDARWSALDDEEVPWEHEARCH